MAELINYRDPLAGAYPRDPKEILDAPRLPEVDLDRVKNAIETFSGTEDEARGLVNIYIGGKVGRVPRPEDFTSNANSYLYSGAADKNPIELLEHIKTGFIPKEDKDHTAYLQYKNLSQEEKWNQIKANYEVGTNVGVGATAAAMMPVDLQRTIPDSEKKIYIEKHEAELRSKSRTAKLELGQNFSERAKRLANQVAITKQAPNMAEYFSLSDYEKQNLFTYISGRNPKHDAPYYKALFGTLGESVGNIFESFKTTGESIVRSELGVEDPEELFLQFNAKFKDKFDLDNLSEEDETEIRNWLINKLQPTAAIDDALMVGEAFTSKTYDTADKIMSSFKEHLEIGAESRLIKSLEQKTKAATRIAYNTNLAGEMGLTAASMFLDLGATAALSVGTFGVGGAAYSAGRFYGDHEESLLNAGVDPDKARAVSLFATIPYILIERVQAQQVFGKEIQGAFAKAVSKISKSKTPQIFSKYADGVTVETFEEMAQELIAEVSKDISFERDPSATFENVMAAGKEAFKGLVVLGGITPAMRAIKGDGDFIEQDAANLIESQFPEMDLTQKEEVELQQFDFQEYQQAEDKQDYIASLGLSNRAEDVLNARLEVIQEKEAELKDLADADISKTDTEVLKDLTKKYKKYAKIKDIKGGVNISTDQGLSVDLFFGGLYRKGARGQFDPNKATIRLKEDTGLPTLDHEAFHVFEDYGLLRKGEVTRLKGMADKYLSPEIKAELKANYGTGGDSLMQSESMARLIEEWTKNPELIKGSDRNLIYKIADFIRDILAKYIDSVGKSGYGIAQDIRSGKILERAPSEGAKRLIDKAKKEKAEAPAKKFEQEGAKEQEQINKELELAKRSLEKINQALPAWVTEDQPTAAKIESTLGIGEQKGLQPDEVITGDEILESELPADYFLSEEERMTPGELFGYDIKRENKILDFISENGKIKLTDELEQEIKNRVGDLKGTSRFANKKGALDWDQMTSLLETEETSPLYGQEVTKDDLLDILTSSQFETKFSLESPPKTGDKIQAYFIHNPESSKNFTAPKGIDLGLDLEPAGKYISIDKNKNMLYPLPGWESGQVNFKNPIVLEHKNTGSTGWKKDLSEMFDNKTGKALTNQIKKQGYDGVVTYSRENGKFSFEESVNIDAKENQDVKFSLAPPTDSEAFKNWFGDSKVVNEDGSPKVVYHGTNIKFTEFVKKFLGKSTKAHSAKQGFFFADVKETAQGYAEFAESQKVTKLLDDARAAERQNNWDLAAKLERQAEELEASLDVTANAQVMETYLSIENPLEMDAEGMWFMDIQDEINKLLIDAQNKGHDGVIIYNLVDNADYGVDTEATHYVAFSPTQIKSATDNVGTYDPANPDIRYSLAPPTDSKAFKDWFGDSKVVNEDGSPMVVYHGTGAEFTEFKKEFFNKIEERGDYIGEGFFFTGSLKKAKAYAKQADGGRVMPVYLSLKNPFIPPKDFFSKMSDDQLMDFFDSKPSTIRESLIEQGYDGLIDLSYDQYAVFEPTQIKSATANVGTFDPTNPDIRYSLGEPTLRHAARILAGDIVLKQSNLKQQEATLKRLGIQAEDQTAVRRMAYEIAEEVSEPMKSVRDDKEILKAIRKASIRQNYQEKVEQLYKEGIKQGEVIEQAKQKIKERRKKLKQQTILDQEQLEGVQEKVQSMTDALSVEKFLNDLELQARKKVFPNKEPKQWQRDPKFLGAYIATAKAGMNHLMKNVAPGTSKQQLRQSIKELSERATYNGIKNHSKKTFNKILKQADKTDRKKVQSDLESLLKKYSTVPEARKENKKRTIDGQKHQFLYHGYQARKYNKEEVNNKLESLQEDMARYMDGKKPSDDINFEEAEIEYRAYMTFGGIMRADTSIADVVSALEYAEEVEADGKAMTEKLLSAHEEKYAPISQAIIDAINSAKPHVNKKDFKNNRDKFLSLFHTMNVRGQLEYLLSYGDADQKKKAESILFKNDASKAAKKTAISQANLRLQEEAAKLGITDTRLFKGIEKFALERSKPEKKYRKYSTEGRTDLSRSNLMQMYMVFRQPDVIEMASRVNNDGQLINPDLFNRLQMMPEIRKELTTQEKQLAEAMGRILEELLPDINQAYKKQYGINMKVQEENYWPLVVQSKQGGFAKVMNTVSEAPGFTISRVAHSNDIKETADIFEVFSGHIEDAAHYVNTIDSQLAIRSTLTNREFREAVRKTYGQDILSQFDESVVDMAIDRSINPDRANETIDIVRSIMSTISIGFNPKSMLVAAIGSVNILSTHNGILKAMSAIPKNPTEYVKDFKFIWDSVVVQNRKDQGLNEQMRNTLQRSKGNKFIRAYQRMAFFPLSNIDAISSSFVGAAIYNQYKNSPHVDGLSQKQIEDNGLAIVDRAIQEAYQPTDADYLPAAIRSGGSATKALFQFKTEPMGKLGIYGKHWQEARALWDKGQKDAAVKKAIKITLGQHILIPGAYWMASEIIRLAAGEETDEEEAAKRLAAHILVGPYAGLVVVGTGMEIIVNLALGNKVYMGSSMPADRVVNEVKFLFNKATDTDEEMSDKIMDLIERYIPIVRYTKKHMEK